MTRSILVTGASGFIGKNLCSELDLAQDVTVLRFDRSNTKEQLVELIREADFIFHLAGVNRPKEESEFTSENKQLTEQIIDILRVQQKKTPFLLSSSVQAELNNPYGQSKLAAENAVYDWQKESGSPTYVYRLPGVFGKWCKPNYNSVVATFCHNIANDLPIEISDPDHVITLAYIDDVVSDFMRHLNDRNRENDLENVSLSRTFSVSLGELADRISTLHSMRKSLVVPDHKDTLNKFLYATYTSYLDTSSFAYSLMKNSDDRGWLAEFLKSNHFGQVFISKTKPGISRGNHWHKTKVEKFLIVEGTGEVTFRNKVGSQEVVTYRVTGDQMKVIDIPTGYVHAITNVGNSDLITLFWANEILDKNEPDTYFENVNVEHTHE